MKVMLNKRQAEWINSNVTQNMNLSDHIEFASIMSKFSQGYMASYITEELLHRILEICTTTRLLCQNAVFYSLCAKWVKIDKNKTLKNTPKFCVRFDNTGGMKIPSIKAMRDLIRSNAFIELEKGLVYDSGLREMKDAVEGGIVLGPYDNEQIRIIKILLKKCSFSVEEYVGQKTLKDVQF